MCGARPIVNRVAEEGLSVGALQQAKMRLHRRGLWPAVRPRFVRVQPATSAVATAAPVVYRVSLPNGVVVESTSGDLSAVWLAQMAMSNAWLKQQGLFSIKEQWTRFHYPTSTA